MTTANPSLPENRIFFDPVHETAVNNFYSVMRESNANLDAMITYLRTTNTSITVGGGGQVGAGQPGSVTEAVMNTVKKLRDENKEVENKWSAYMALQVWDEWREAVGHLYSERRWYLRWYLEHRAHFLGFKTICYGHLLWRLDGPVTRRYKHLL